LKNTLILKDFKNTLALDSTKSIFTQINYPDPILNTATTPSLHQTLGFGSSKPLITLDQQSPPI